MATLLLAMGVGVLIGENGAGNSKNLAAASPQVITVNGGGQSNVASSGGGSSNSSGSTRSPAKGSKHGRSSSSSSGKSGPTVIHVTKKVAGQMTTALNSVVGTSAHTVSPTTKLGGKCQSGQSGCQGGKFTGNFFGGG